jgi:hypothetical protein
MVKVLIYGCATGAFSSRKLAAKLHEEVALQGLAAENYPAHRTLSDFRALHLQELTAFFVQVLLLARECGLATCNDHCKPSLSSCPIGTWVRRHPANAQNARPARVTALSCAVFCTAP